MVMIIWLTGLPASGKSAVATALAVLLRERGQRVETLDGDDIRAVLSPDLGFSEAERNQHIRRIGWLAQMLERHDVTVIVSAISPYRAVRDEVRAGAHRFVEVFVDTPLDVCVSRDTKGTYQRQAVTGVDAPYEKPLHPEVHLHPGTQTVAECVRDVLAWVGLETGVPYSLLIGRWQVPFLHDGHKTLIQTVVDEGKPVCVGIRDTAISPTDPYTVAERQAIIEQAFPGIKTCVIPDIAEIVFGRKVGYGIRELHLAPEIEALSGTAIREAEHGHV